MTTDVNDTITAALLAEAKATAQSIRTRCGQIDKHLETGEGHRIAIAVGALRRSGKDLEATISKVESMQDLSSEGKNAATTTPDTAPREHDWFTYGRLNWECCRVCGVVRRKDGKNSPCKGPVAVGPRTEDEAAEAMDNGRNTGGKH